MTPPLLAIELQWPNGVVTLLMRYAEGERRVIMRDVTRLECPREQPWGPSKSINGIEVVTPASGEGLRMEIEMQSGDRIILCGSALDVVGN